MLAPSSHTRPRGDRVPLNCASRIMFMGRASSNCVAGFHLAANQTHARNGKNNARAAILGKRAFALRLLNPSSPLTVWARVQCASVLRKIAGVPMTLAQARRIKKCSTSG